jgi:hypothetical protein
MPTLPTRIVQPVPITRFGGGGSPASGRTCIDEARGTRRDRPGYVVLPDALGARANPETKGTIGMTTRPNITAQDLSAVPAVRGNER